MESVVRHRGAGFDANGDPSTETDLVLQAKAVAPGATKEFVARGRDGGNVAYSVYFVPEVDLQDTDELTVRGKRYAVQAEQWRAPVSSWSGTVAMCTGGTG